MYTRTLHENKLKKSSLLFVLRGSKSATDNFTFLFLTRFLKCFVSAVVSVSVQRLPFWTWCWPVPLEETTLT